MLFSSMKTDGVIVNYYTNWLCIYLQIMFTLYSPSIHLSILPFRFKQGGHGWNDRELYLKRVNELPYIMLECLRHIVLYCFFYIFFKYLMDL